VKYRRVLVVVAANLGVGSAQRVGAPTEYLDKVSVDEGLSEGPAPAIPLRRTSVFKLTQRF
jgi:hypothetical protein